MHEKTNLHTSSSASAGEFAVWCRIKCTPKFRGNVSAAVPWHHLSFQPLPCHQDSSEGWAAAFSFVRTSVIAVFHWTGSPSCPTAAPFQSYTSTGRQTWHPGALSRHTEELAQHWHSHPTQLERCQKQSQFTTRVRLSQSYCGTAPYDNLDSKTSVLRWIFRDILIIGCAWV